MNKYEPDLNAPHSEILMPLQSSLVDDLIACRKVLDDQNVPEHGRMLMVDEDYILSPNDFIHMTRDELARVKWNNRKWHREHPGMVLLENK